jgi:UDP-N-acetylglucosamine 1-carboxyvinyltransferase
MISNEYIIVEKSPALQGTVDLYGAKNAVLVIIASLLLTRGKSRLSNVPASDDVFAMITLIESLGGQAFFYEHEHVLEIDTSSVNKWQVSAQMMKKMRASILVMGPLVALFGKAEVALPGGCVIGERSIDYHLKNFKKMGAYIDQVGDYLNIHANGLHAQRLVLEYPSVGATENILMAATLTHGITTIVNAALEPEVLDLIAALRKMGAHIEIQAPATICIEGVASLQPIEHTIMVDRLEAGALLLAAAISGGTLTLPQACAYSMDVFLFKLEEMGHEIIVGPHGIGITIKATKEPKAVSFKTAPYPGFPTDLQAPMMAAQCLAQGTSVVEETVFENRLVHVRELQKMGAQIKVMHNKATIIGVEKLYGASVIATDIRASCALVLAGLVADGSTIMTGIHHWTRGYDGLEKKLACLGAMIAIHTVKENQSFASQELMVDTSAVKSVVSM